MFKAGIIDPLKVVRTALENAASIAGLMLTTETLVTDLNKEDKKKPRRGERAVECGDAVAATGRVAGTLRHGAGRAACDRSVPA